VILQQLGLILLECCCRCDIKRDALEGAMALNLDVSQNRRHCCRSVPWPDLLWGISGRATGINTLVMKETNRIVLNLAWVVYIDSSGLGTLVASFISARHRGAEIKFAALSPRARRLFTITKVDRIFEVYDSAEEAVKSFRPHPEAAAS